MMTEKDQGTLSEDQTGQNRAEKEDLQAKEEARSEEAQPQVEEAPEVQVPEQEQEKDLASQLEALQAQLTEAQAKAEEYLDGWQRSRAEFANFRRRQEHWQNSVREQAVARLLTNLLPALDDLERALEKTPEEMRDNAWVEGFALVSHKLDAILKREGLSEIPVQPGDEFDPNYHEAILHEPSTEFEEGEIANVLQKGHKLNNVVLRPAVVCVSSGKIDESQACENTDS
jgi:molecular chaperone GrpE